MATIKPRLDKNGKPIKNRWEVYLSFGFDAETGKRIRQHYVKDGTKTEVKRWAEEQERDAQDGLNIMEGKQSFSHFADEWLDGRKHEHDAGRLSYSTYSQDRHAVKMWNDELGSKRMDTITAQMVSKALQAIERKIYEKRGEYPSSTTMRKYFGVARQIFNSAYLADAIRRNPCAALKSPKQAESRRRALTTDEIASLVESINTEEENLYRAFDRKELHLVETGHRNKERHGMQNLVELSYIIGVRILLATGMRVGELLALTWGNVDLEQSTITIEKSRNAQGKIKEPKTRRGYRSDTIDTMTAGHLKQWRDFVEEQRGKIGLSTEEDAMSAAPVICSKTFGFCDASNLNHWWNEWREQHGMSGVLLYELRHTQVTRLIAAGHDPLTVSKRTGHDPYIVFKHYAHADDSDDRKCASTMDDLFTGTDPKIIYLNKAQ